MHPGLDLGLLLLRLLLGGLIAAHGAQKLFGWFSGHGPKGTAPIFESWGLRPGTSMVRLAAFCEITGSVLIVLGLFTPLGAAAIADTLLVAASIFWGKGIWATGGGYELPFLYAACAVVLGFTGPGAWSLDHAMGFHPGDNPIWGLAALVAAVAAAGVVVSMRQRALGRPVPSPAPGS